LVDLQPERFAFLQDCRRLAGFWAEPDCLSWFPAAMFVSALQPAALFEVVLQAEPAVPFEAALQRQVPFWQSEQRLQAEVRVQWLQWLPGEVFPGK
jgi:hypothetical protein